MRRFCFLLEAAWQTFLHFFNPLLNSIKHQSSVYTQLNNQTEGAPAEMQLVYSTILADSFFFFFFLIAYLRVSPEFFSGRDNI